MKTVRIPLLLGLLALPAAAWAGPADDPRVSAPPPAASGVYSVTFHLNGATPVPTGATITCKAKIVPTLPGAPSRNIQPAVGIGSPGGCALEIPFLWLLSQPQSGAELSYEVDAVSGSGAVLRSASPQPVAVGLPPAGGTARLNVAVNF